MTSTKSLIEYTLVQPQSSVTRKHTLSSPCSSSGKGNENNLLNKMSDITDLPISLSEHLTSIFISMRSVHYISWLYFILKGLHFIVAIIRKRHFMNMVYLYRDKQINMKISKYILACTSLEAKAHSHT